MAPLDYFLIVVGLILLVLFIIFFMKAVKGVKEEEQRSNSYEPKSSLEIIAGETLEKESQRAKVMATSFFISVVTLALSDLWNWFMKPKPVITTGVILAGAFAYFGYIGVYTKSDDVVITVFGPENKFPSKLLEGVTVIIEARDSSTNDKKLIDDIKFSTVEENKVPTPNHISTITNKDGIAFAHLKGIFESKTTVFKIKVITNESNYQNDFRDDTSSYFAYKKEQNEFKIYLKPKRKVVYGALDVYGKIDSKDESQKLQPGEIPPKTFKVEVNLLNYEGLPSTDGHFYLIKSDGDSSAFDFKGGVFSKEEIPLSDKPYKISYLVEDSSKVKVNLSPEGAEGKFKFDKMDKYTTLSETTKGSMPSIKPKFGRASTEKSENFQYQIIFNDDIVDKKNITDFKIYIGDTPIIIGTPKGPILVPEKPIENFDLFWKDIPVIKIQYKYKTKPGHAEIKKGDKSVKTFEFSTESGEDKKLIFKSK